MRLRASLQGTEQRASVTEVPRYITACVEGVGRGKGRWQAESFKDQLLDPKEKGKKGKTEGGRGAKRNLKIGTHSQ